MKRFSCIVGGFLLMTTLFGYSAEHPLRKWTWMDGTEVEARLLTMMGGKAVLQDAHGRRSDISLTELSPEDRLYIELSNPPKLSLSFRRKTQQKHFSTRFNTTLLPEIQINTFGVRVQQLSSGKYPHELQVEFFAIGRERAGKRFILLDHQTETFVLTEANERAYACWGTSMELDKYEIYYIDRPRGKKYVGHLILVTDLRGEVIASQVSQPWLLTYVSPLRELPLGAYMDETCTRTFPTRPRPCRY